MHEKRRCTAGELEDAIRQYGDQVYRMAYAVVRNRTDADDIFQEVFLKFFEAAPAFAGAEHQKAWLLRVTINRARSELRSAWRRRVIALSEEVAFTDPESNDLDQTLRRLSRPHRTVIHLFYYEGYSTAQIAVLLGKRPSAIRTQLTRARASLSRLLKEDEACFLTATEK